MIQAILLAAAFLHVPAEAQCKAILQQAATQLDRGWSHFGQEEAASDAGNYDAAKKYHSLVNEDLYLSGRLVDKAEACYDARKKAKAHTVNT